MAFIEIAGWLAALCTLTAYAMRTMVPLRIAALAANVLFILWSIPQGLIPTLVLHILLLPFNLYRLWEIRDATTRLRKTRGGDDPLEVLAPLLKPVKMKDGQYIFRKGDPPDRLYFVSSGEVVLEEIAVRLGPGDLFGEIAFLTDARERTVSARCRAPCEIAAIDEATFMKLYGQNPEFGLYIMKLATRRLMEGMAARPEAYRPVSEGGTSEGDASAS